LKLVFRRSKAADTGKNGERNVGGLRGGKGEEKKREREVRDEKKKEG